MYYFDQYDSQCKPTSLLCDKSKNNIKKLCKNIFTECQEN